MEFIGGKADDMMGTQHMTCAEFAEFLAEYVAGTLDAERRETFDAHLADCADCAKYLSSYRLTIELGKQAMSDVDAPEPLEMPAALKKAILAARKPQ